MSLGFRKFISEVFKNGKFPKILPSENFPLYGIHIFVLQYHLVWSHLVYVGTKVGWCHHNNYQCILLHPIMGH